MKKVLAIVITLVMLAAMVPISAYALTMPDELTAAGAMEIGTWPLPAGAYDPNLDSAGIPNGAYVYGLYEFDMTTFVGTNYDFPAAISGFTKVGDISELTAGTYAEAEIGGYNYVILLDGGAEGGDAATTNDEPAAPASGTAAPVPAEIANAGAMELGVWPLASGTYDPSLDGEGIAAGAYMYGFFDSGYANIDLPASIGGYTEVSTAADLTEGSYVGLVVNGFNYVAIMPIGGAFEALAAPAPADTTPDDAAPAEEDVPVAAGPAGEIFITISVDGKLEVVCESIVPDKMTVEGVIQKAHELYYPGGASGFAGGIDATYNMYLINTCWGIENTPYVAINEGMLSGTADTTAVKAGDNILVACGSSVPVVLTAEESEEGIVVSAKLWVLDFATFSYSSSPFADGKIIDKAGNELGTTDGDGKYVVADIPSDGIIVLDGLSAININTSITAPVVIDNTLRRAFVSVSIDKSLTVAAQTVQISESELTLENVIIKAHELYCLNGGVSGYGNGLMWGISNANYLILVNDKIVTDLSTKLKANDNILITMSTNPQQPAVAVYIEAFINGSYVTGKAVIVNADGSKTPLVGVAIVGSDGTGLTHPDAAWGSDGEVTDANGEFYVSNPANGIIAMDGLTAFNSIYGADYPIFKGDVRLMRFFIPALVVNIPLLIVIVFNWKKWHLKDK